MRSGNHPFLMTALLVAMMLRVTMGAPCCLGEDAHGAAQPMAETHHAHHAMEHAGNSAAIIADRSGHEGHGEDNRSNPCCSACGPTLPPTDAKIPVLALTHLEPQSEAIRALATAPPFPAYDATGPPLKI